MTRTYTLEQIIFGLRSEYLQIDHQLATLKKLFTFGPTVSHAFMSIDKLQFDPSSRLSLLLHRKPKMLINWAAINKNFSSEDNVSFTLDDYHIAETVCFPQSHELAYRIVDISAFQEIFNKIKASAFVHHIDAGLIKINTTAILNLLINTDGVHLFDDDYGHLLDYHSGYDSITFYKNNRGSIKQILATPVECDSLNPYHCQVIDNYQPKELVLPESVEEKTILTIDDGEKCYLKSIN